MGELANTLIPAIVPVIVWGMKKVAKGIPRKHIPTIVAIVGLFYGILTGQQDAEVTKMAQEGLQGMFLALSGVGVHQLYKQTKKSD